MAIKARIVTIALRVGFLVPFLYFGIQLAAAPFFPGYSFLARDASTLGSLGSRLPSLFNVGCLVIGLLTLIAAWGVFRAFQILEVGAIISWLTTLALVSSALGSINAGLFPLPDPRHTDGVLALCGAGIFLLPFFLPVALWKLLERGPVTAYFVANIVAMVALVPIMSGLVQRFAIGAGIDMPGFQTFLNNYQGLLQRIAALIIFVPISVSARFLIFRLAPERTAGRTGLQSRRDGSRQHL